MIIGGHRFWPDNPREKNLKHGGTEETEEGSNGMFGSFFVSVCCKRTKFAASSDLCFLCASVFQIPRIEKLADFAREDSQVQTNRLFRGVLLILFEFAKTDNLSVSEGLARNVEHHASCANSRVSFSKIQQMKSGHWQSRSEILVIARGQAMLIAGSFQRIPSALAA